MMPKSAVAERATITRLCARLRRWRRFIIISVLRDHRGLRRDHNTVACGIPNDRDPWLEEIRDLDLDLPSARVADARAVPDEAAIRRRRCGRATCGDGLARAGIGRQGEAAAELALHRRHHGGIGRQRGIEGDGGAGALARSIRDRVVDVDRTAQVDRPEQQQEEHRCEDGELHHRLAAMTPDECLAHQYSALKTELVLIVKGSPINVPMIGVMNLNWKRAETVIPYCEVGVAPLM